MSPTRPVFQQIRPERKQSALDWLYNMDRTTAVAEKVALRSARLPEAPEVPGPVDIAVLEGLHGQPKKCRDLLRIGSREVDVARHLTATRAPLLASKSNCARRIGGQTLSAHHNFRV
jgi:hypothetical protein